MKFFNKFKFLINNLRLWYFLKSDKMVQTVVVYWAFLVLAAGVVGYSMNIAEIIVMDWGADSTGELIIRLFGVVSGFGAIIGWF